MTEKLSAKMSIVCLLVCLFAWGAAIYFSFMSMVSCSYDCYPLDVFGALGATVVIGSFCRLISRKPNKATGILAWIGRNSMGLLCLHLIDLECGVVHKL